MAAASQPVSFRIERHEVIEQTEDCLICGDEEVPVDVWRDGTFPIHSDLEWFPD